jgi:hypothetical protein
MTHEHRIGFLFTDEAKAVAVLSAAGSLKD